MKNYFEIIFSILLIFFSFSVADACSGLSGTYTIGGSGASYASFTAAVNDLNSKGVCGPVIFEVNDGTYTEQITIHNIKGSSGYNYIIFRSKSLDSSKVILTYPGSNNFTDPDYTLGLDHANFIGFNNLTIRRSGASFAYTVVLQILDSSNYNGFSQNAFIAPNGNEAVIARYVVDSFGSNHNYIGFNFINNGLYGIDWEGSGGSHQVDSGNYFDSNIIDSSKINAAYIHGQFNLFFVGNIISNPIGDGLSIARDQDLFISNNKIFSTNGTALSVMGVFSYGNAFIYNNYFSAIGYGSCVYMKGNTGLGFYYNNVYCKHGIALSCDQTNFESENNILFADDSSGYAEYINSFNNNGGMSDYNDLYNSSGKNLVKTDNGSSSVSYSNLDSVNVYTSYGNNQIEQHSDTFNPGFVSWTNLMTQNKKLMGKGIPVSMVGGDIDNNPRNSKTPTIGANEIPFAIDAGIYSINNWNFTTCTGMQPVIAGLKNYGSNTLTSVTIHYSINGSPSTFHWTGNLTHSATALVNLGNYNFASGTTTITAGTILLNDSNPTNDSSEIVITANTKPTVAFKFTNACLGDTSKFTNISTNFANSLWLFGDGKGDTSASPTHTYASAGNYMVTLIAQNGSGCVDSVSHTILIDSACVWPGDANNDKVVDASDILSIGVGYGKTGPARAGASAIWKGQPAASWKYSFSNGVNYKSADCNGDSTIDYTDTIAVRLNYSKTHLKTSSRNQGSPTDAPLYLVFLKKSLKAGDTLIADIMLGKQTIPATNIYGLSFIINYPSQYINSTYTKVDFSGSWLKGNAKELGFSINQPSQGQIDFAVCRINHKDTSGYGKIATFKMVLNNSVSQNQLIYSFGDNKQINSVGKILPVYLIDDSATILTGFDQEIQSSLASLTVQPNPFNDRITINVYLNKPMCLSYRIYSLTGQELIHSNEKTLMEGGYSETLNLSPLHLQKGIYLLKINTSEGQIVKSIVRMN